MMGMELILFVQIETSKKANEVMGSIDLLK